MRIIIIIIIITNNINNKSSCHYATLQRWRAQVSIRCLYMWSLSEKHSRSVQDCASSSCSSSISTRAAWRLACEPSLNRTLLMTPALGALIVCCKCTGWYDKSNKQTKNQCGFKWLKETSSVYLHLHCDHHHERISLLHSISDLHKDLQVQLHTLKPHLPYHCKHQFQYIVE